MSVIQPGGSGDAPEIPDGLYTATIKGVKDITLDQPDTFGNQEKVEIQVAFRDVDGNDQTLEPRVNRKWGEKATLFSIAMACGLDIGPHEAFDTEELVGRKVNVLVETPDEGKWPRVKSWGRVKNGKASAPAQKAEQASCIESDGSANFTVFWTQMNKAGIDRKNVIDYVGGDIDTLMEMDGLELQETMDLLLAKANQ